MEAPESWRLCVPRNFGTLRAKHEWKGKENEAHRRVYNQGEIDPYVELIEKCRDVVNNIGEAQLFRSSK